MKWYRQLPFAVYSVLLSLAVGLTLWLLRITGESAAILSALALELVVVSHRVLLQVEKADDPLRGMLRTAKIDEALVAAREILRSGNPQARALLEGTANAFADRVRALQSGGIRCSPSDFMEFAEGLFESAKTGDQLCATSHLAGGDYWNMIYGQQYERLNRVAQGRGLTIERIFLLRDEQHLAEVREILHRQSDFSSIKIILLNSIDGSMVLPRRDFFVYNQDATAEFIFTEPNMTVEYIHISTEAHRVRELAREYARMRDAFSCPYSTPTAAEAQ